MKNKYLNKMLNKSEVTFGEPRRGGHQPPPGQAAVALVGKVESAQLAGNSHREAARLKMLGGGGRGG